MVAYRLQRRSALRQEWYRGNAQISLLVLPGVVAAFTVLGCYMQSTPLSTMALICLAVFAATAGLWSLFLALWMAVALLIRYPRMSSFRPGVVLLVADGICSHLRDGTAPLPWTQVRQIRFYAGDVFFRIDWRGGPDILVPRESFPEEASARRFFDAALVLWRSGGTVWPEDPAVMAEFAPCLPAQAEEGNRS